MPKSLSVFIVTGLSGSGKSSALKALEDFGCEVIDNFPISLCPALLSERTLQRPLALGIDVRTRDFGIETFLTCVEHLRKLYPSQVKILFFEANTETLQNRYRETRRLHPLGIGSQLDLLIEKEKKLLDPIRTLADVILNTTPYSIPEMRSYLQQHLSLHPPCLTLYLLSFAFPKGVPHYADFVFDMRFLKNPHYQSDMRALTGTMPKIQSFVASDPDFLKFLQAWEILFLDTVLPKFQEDNRHSAVIAFGCTGGKHRSVSVTEITSKALRAKGYQVQVTHRDLA